MEIQPDGADGIELEVEEDRALVGGKFAVPADLEVINGPGGDGNMDRFRNREAARYGAQGSQAGALIDAEVAAQESGALSVRQ